MGQGNTGDSYGQIAECLNSLGTFCGVRDLPELTQGALEARYGFGKADAMVLFGGSILCGGDLLAQAMGADIAEKYIIVGGVGHTTRTLQEEMQAFLPGMDTSRMPEAKLFAAYLDRQYGLAPDFLEWESTNCGNNITHLLRLVEAHGLPFQSVILAQDATMQRRMDAGLRRHAVRPVTIINYATYSARVIAAGSGLQYARPIPGMWEMAHYIRLLMGEIPRLTDAPGGYGPTGKDFIAHVDIPPSTRQAYAILQGHYAHMVREANPLYASLPEK